MSDTTHTAPTLAELRARRDEIIRLAEQHGASNVRVFGSVARGDATPESDIDLLVSFPPKTSIFAVVGLWQDLTEFFQTKVDLVTDHEAQTNPFKRRIVNEAVPL